eukprot:SAG22_NODE_3310_length_1788_cov_1.157490_1_plen_375_part_10
MHAPRSLSRSPPVCGVLDFLGLSFFRATLSTLSNCLSGGHDGRIKIWNLSNGKLLKVRTKALSFCCASTAFLSKTAPFLSVLKEFVKPTRLTNDKREITSLLYYAGHTFRYVIAAGWDQRVTIWTDEARRDVLDGKVPKQMSRLQCEGHTDDIRCLAFFAPNVLASGSDNGEIIVWTIEPTNGYMRHKMSDHAQQPPRKAAEAAGGFFSASQEQTIEKLAFLPTSGMLVSCGGDGCIRVWEPTRGILLHRERAGHTRGQPIMAMSVASVEKGKRTLMLTGDAAGSIKLWDLTFYDHSVAADMQPDLDQPNAEMALKELLHWKAHDDAVISVSFVQKTAPEPEDSDGSRSRSSSPDSGSEADAPPAKPMDPWLMAA